MNKQEPLIPDMPLFETAAKKQAEQIPTRPDFADNREITLAAALKSHFQWLRQTWAKPVELAIASGGLLQCRRSSI